MKPNLLQLAKTTVFSIFISVLISTNTLAAPVTIIMSNDSPEISLKGQTFNKFAEELKKRLGDKINIRLEHAGTLFNQKDQVQALQLGAVHFIAPTTETYASISEGLNALNLPFLLDTPEKFSAAIVDEIIRNMYVPNLQNKNIEPVAMWMNGPRVLGYKGNKAILEPTDIEGMKIRVQSAPVFVKTFEAVNANPLSINWSETPTAVQQGVIDGTEVTPNAWKASGMYKSINHLTLTNHMYSYYMIGTNKMWWDGLPKNIREDIADALKAATEWNINHAIKLNNDAIEFMKKAGVEIHYLNPEQHEKWVNAMQPVWNELGEPLVGTKVMTRLKEISKTKVD